MIVRFFAAVVFVSIGCATQAQAHGGVSIDEGQCKMKIGPDQMNFTGYQPLKSREQFCDDIPDVGPTIIVLDAVQDELRDMNLEIRILRDVGQSSDDENLEHNTETYVPAKKYRTGTLNFEYDFKQKGKFIGLVKARNDDGSKEYVSRFPFSVGETETRDITIATFFASLGLVGFGLWYKNSFKAKPSARRERGRSAVVALSSSLQRRRVLRLAEGGGGHVYRSTARSVRDRRRCASRRAASASRGRA